MKTSGSRKSYKVFGLTEYFSGKFFYKAHEGRLNSDSYTAFSKGVLKKTSRHLILIQDRAPYHVSGALREFFRKHAARMTVYGLPSYPPDYNPVEMLRKKIKEKETHLHYFPTFASLKRKVNQALVRFENMRDEVLRLSDFTTACPGKNPPVLRLTLI